MSPRFNFDGHASQLAAQGRRSRCLTPFRTRSIPVLQKRLNMKIYIIALYGCSSIHVYVYVYVHVCTLHVHVDNDSVYNCGIYMHARTMYTARNVLYKRKTAGVA